MSNNNKSVYERLDSIEATQSATQAQNKEIIELLKNLKNQQQIKQNEEFKLQPQVSEQQLIKKFIQSAKKEYVWFGPNYEFKKSKIIVNVLFVILIIVGVISTILTSISLNMYSTFTLFENIWLIFACLMFSHSLNAKKRMLDTDLKNHSNTIFIKDTDGTWRDTKKEKKKYKWFRRISYIAVIANIIFILTKSNGAITIFAILFELAFAGLTIGFFFAYINLFCMYGNFILFTGMNLTNTANITLLFDVKRKKLIPYNECKENIKEYL